MGVVAEIENTLGRLREKESVRGDPVLRTSTMTHLVWAPLTWLPQARRTLAGLRDRHPARTILLVPEPGREGRVTAKASLHGVQVDGGREAFAEVIEIRLRGEAGAHPASIVLPLLISDLPVFCRWRGEPDWTSSQLRELVSVADRLVVNSSEWRGLPEGYVPLAELFDRIVVSDIAFSRTLGWRLRLAQLWPAIGSVERIRVEGPQAEALLLAGWLRSRLRREVELSTRVARELRALWVDGRRVARPENEVPSGSDLLSAELDVFSRDRIYEAAAKAAT